MTYDCFTRLNTVSSDFYYIRTYWTSAVLSIYAYCRICFQGSEYVVALKSFVTDEKSLLSFQKGDIIKRLHMDDMQDGRFYLLYIQMFISDNAKYNTIKLPFEYVLCILCVMLWCDLDY